MLVESVRAGVAPPEDEPAKPLADATETAVTPPAPDGEQVDPSVHVVPLTVIEGDTLASVPVPVVRTKLFVPLPTPVDPTTSPPAIGVHEEPSVHEEPLTVIVGETRSPFVTNPVAVKEPVTVGVANVGDVLNTTEPLPVDVVVPVPPFTTGIGGACATACPTQASKRRAIHLFIADTTL